MDAVESREVLKRRICLETSVAINLKIFRPPNSNFSSQREHVNEKFELIRAFGNPITF